MTDTSACLNCQRRRRAVKRAGLCSKCYYWHRKKGRLQREFSSIAAPDRTYRTLIAQSGIREAERVLREYRWREERLNSEDVHALDLESLIYAVAGECRSEVRCAGSLHSLLSRQTVQARKLLFLILLEIVEGIPSRRPRLGTLKPPKRGTHPDPWSDFFLEFRR